MKNDGDMFYAANKLDNPLNLPGKSKKLAPKVNKVINLLEFGRF